MQHLVYRFGHFQLDASAHLLTKDGTRLAIQEQPFQVLQAMLENPGQVVTRETLRMRLWGTDTFVDFDQSLNSAVRRLRMALEDNSREPTFVETIPRIGFRFLVPVMNDGIGPLSAPGRLETPAHVSAAGGKQLPPDQLPRDHGSRFSLRGLVIVSVAVGLGMGMMVGSTSASRVAKTPQTSGAMHSRFNGLGAAFSRNAWRSYVANRALRLH